MPERIKILVVDDERSIATTLADVFEMHGYEAATAFSGEEGISVARKFRPDMLVSDVMMGAMNGIEAAIEILAELPQCKVLFISGNVLYNNSPGCEALRRANAKGYHFEVLQKPVRAPDLLGKISQILFTGTGT